MKLMVASDIHGSAKYCSIMLEQFRQEKAAKLILLGDLLYHGPRNPLPENYAPKEVAAMLNQLANRIMCVRGNCDSEVDQMVLDFPIMADYALLQSGEHLVYITHGHVWNKEHMPNLTPGDILIHGHTHVQCNEEAGQIRVLNPGSVSLPKGDGYRGYMTLEDGDFIWKNLEGKPVDRLEL